MGISCFLVALIFKVHSKILIMFILTGIVNVIGTIGYVMYNLYITIIENLMIVLLEIASIMLMVLFRKMGKDTLAHF